MDKVRTRRTDEIKGYPDHMLWIPRQDFMTAWEELLDKTNELHDLKCGSCDEEVEQFINKFMKGFT